MSLRDTAVCFMGPISPSIKLFENLDRLIDKTEDNEDKDEEKDEIQYDEVVYDEDGNDNHPGQCRTLDEEKMRCHILDCLVAPQKVLSFKRKKFEMSSK
jgi:hypothetical protein